MSYAVGSLVNARGREWVVLPETTDDFLVVRPLGGTDLERAGIYLPLEGGDVTPARFEHPDPTQPGDFRSCQLLRDAVRLGFRSSAGPFRSFGRISLEPRPYQLVPLLMALKLEPVRLLIADDVGIGKTIEALLILRELLDRGEVQRFAVLCPPHLAEQWQDELRDKFHIDAELVLPSTVNRLERNTATGQSLFDLYPYVIVSTEYIKSSRHRDEFVRACPELVIVDEAHTCAFSADNRGGRHLRHQLLRELSKNEARHLILVTATPHSGNEGAFRSLLGLLRPDFDDLPADLSGSEQQRTRREIANHLVQRRRADVREFMDASTPFPVREEAEESYRLSDDYRRLFTALLDYAQERVLDKSGDRRSQRVRWWSALALLRSLASSPAAAAATLRARSATAETLTAEEADFIGERTVLDLEETDAAEVMDVTPGGVEEAPEEAAEETTVEPRRTGRERLLRLARRAEELMGPKQDAKLATMIRLVKKLLADGYNPILFCRFIATAEYVAGQLGAALPKSIEVASVTGLLSPAERQQRVEELADHTQRVLVATDCLSEGINLQNSFNAVVHYDLSWNPTRHEQREGRVDRYGQPSATVRTLTYYGVDNQIDGVVLDVLLRKHRNIRTSLGISVPVPSNTNDVVQALLEGLMLRGSHRESSRGQLSFTELSGDFAAEIYRDLHTEWDNATEREKRSRTIFAQQTMDVGEVAAEWQAMAAAIGAGVDVERFVRNSVTAHGGFVSAKRDALEVHLPNQVALRAAVGDREQFTARFALPVADDVLYLDRTHPIVTGLATHLLDSALDPLIGGVARRCGAIRTRAVGQLTTLLLLRYRYHIVTRRGSQTIPLLAEECELAGFRGNPNAPYWLAPDEAEALLQAQPDSNIAPAQATQFLRRVLDAMPALQNDLDQRVILRGEELLTAHQRVRSAARLTGVRHTIEPQRPPDLLGVYLLLPVGG
ncbi:MAG: DEAD/DEAH box helicase [Caldilineaceae bacterium]|nr:DEAD/DEAH box helicase [Caldilineaceae bacterium]